MDRLRRAAGPSRANPAAVLPAPRRACGNRGRVPEAPEPQQHPGPRSPSVPFPTADPTTRATVPPAQPCCPRRGTCGNNKPQDQTAKPGPDLMERPASRPRTGACPGRNPSPASNTRTGRSAPSPGTWADSQEFQTFPSGTPTPQPRSQQDEAITSKTPVPLRPDSLPPRRPSRTIPATNSMSSRPTGEP